MKTTVVVWLSFVLILSFFTNAARTSQDVNTTGYYKNVSDSNTHNQSDIKNAQTPSSLSLAITKRDLVTLVSEIITIITNSSLDNATAIERYLSSTRPSRLNTQTATPDVLANKIADIGHVIDSTSKQPPAITGITTQSSDMITSTTMPRVKTAAEIYTMMREVGDEVPSETELYDWLFRNYSAACRPRKRASSGVEVNLQLQMFEINDIRERDHSIILTATLNMVWMDEFLVWDTHPQFSRIFLTVVPPTSIWLPDFAITTAPSMYDFKLSAGIYVNLYSNGQVFFNPKTSFTSACEFDLTFFPFDSQQCHVQFVAWTYLPKAQYFSLNDPPWDLSGYMANEQWELYGTAANVHIDCPTNATGSQCNSVVDFILYLSRKPSYYVLNVIIPTIIISIAEFSTFSLEIGEPIKLHISFTCLLAFSVFQTAINVDMPRTSDHTPLLSEYIILTMAYITIAIIFEALVFFSLSCAKDNKPLPHWIRVTCLCIGQCLSITTAKVEELADEMAEKMPHEKRKYDEYPPLMVRYGIYSTDDSYSASAPSPNVTFKANISNSDNNNSQVEEPDTVPVSCDWYYVSMVISRLNFVSYVILVAITPVVMFYVTPVTELTLQPIVGNLTALP